MAKIGLANMLAHAVVKGLYIFQVNVYQIGI